MPGLCYVCILFAGLELGTQLGSCRVQLPTQTLCVPRFLYHSYIHLKIVIIAVLKQAGHFLNKAELLRDQEIEICVQGLIFLIPIFGGKSTMYQFGQ